MNEGGDFWKYISGVLKELGVKKNKEGQPVIKPVEDEYVGNVTECLENEGEPVRSEVKKQIPDIKTGPYERRLERYLAQKETRRQAAEKLNKQPTFKGGKLG